MLEAPEGRVLVEIEVAGIVWQTSADITCQVRPWLYCLLSMLHRHGLWCNWGPRFLKILQDLEHIRMLYCKNA